MTTKDFWTAIGSPQIDFLTIFSSIPLLPTVSFIKIQYLANIFAPLNSLFVFAVHKYCVKYVATESCFDFVEALLLLVCVLSKYKQAIKCSDCLRSIRCHCLISAVWFRQARKTKAQPVLFYSLSEYITA
jgi:hypothetical protein